MMQISKREMCELIKNAINSDKGKAEHYITFSVIGKPHVTLKLKA